MFTVSGVPIQVVGEMQLAKVKSTILTMQWERSGGLDGKSMATELQAALETVQGAKPRVVYDHGGEFVNRDVSAVIKAHNLIDIKTKPRHLESNGVVERFNGTVRDETNNDYGENNLQAEAIIAKLMHHYNAQRLHAALGDMMPAIWHRGQPVEVRHERARRTAAARTNRKTINQQRFRQAAQAVKVSLLSSGILSKLT